MRNFLIIFIFFVFGINQNVYSQCNIVVDTSNITHIACPNGGAVGAAQIIQANYLNFSWENITNGQLYNGGGGVGGTSRTDLDAGFYVIIGSWPYSSSCPTIIYSDTFEIKMPIVNIQPNPNQACPSPNQCDVSTSISLTNTIASNNYSWKVNNLPQNTVNASFSNLCGGSHTYEVFANSQSCGTENFGISQLSINLSTSVTNVTCTQSGSATVSISGGGASSPNNYCLSSPQQSIISTINNVSLIGDNNSITNNTSGICNLYSDFTSQLADVTPGNSYSLDLDLGSCISSYYIDIANIFVDWNLDGDFNDVNENIATIPPTQSPSSHPINFTVPANAVPGQSRMRIVMQNYSSQTSNQAGPCSNNIAVFGETEDYTIVVNGSVVPPVTYLWSDGQTTQTSTNLLAGTYNVTITDANGCTATDTAIISDLSTNVSVLAAGSQTICYGGTPSPLSATSLSSGTYSWSPASAFVDPNVQNPVFASGLTSTTTYTCTFSSGSCTDTDVVLITVNPISTVTLSAVPNPACEGDDIVLTAVASTGFPYEYKFMYNDGTGWSGNSVTTPAWDINNSVIYNNITQSTQFRVKVRENSSCLTSSWSPIVAVTVNWLPSQTIATSQTVCLGGVVPDLFAIGSLPTWYSDQALTNQVFQGNYYATGQTAVGLYTYYVTESLNGCEGAAVPVTLEIYDSPIVIATADQTICNGYAPSSLNASSASAGTYSWVDAADPLGIVLGTGSNFAPPPLTITTTYTVTFTETISGCTDNDDVTITVNPLLITPPIWHN